MESLVDFDEKAFADKRRSKQFFADLEKAKEVLYDDPSIDELLKLKSWVQGRSHMYDAKIEELKAYIKAHSEDNYDHTNEKHLIATYKNLRADMEYLAEYIGKIKISYLVETPGRNGIFKKMWNKITNNGTS